MYYSGDNGRCRDNYGGDDRDGDTDYCKNSGYVCGDVGNDDSSESNDDGDGDGDGFKAKFNIIGDVPLECLNLYISSRPNSTKH